MASKNIPVNGWPQLKDLEAVQPTLDRLDKIEAWKRTVKEETFTGEEITIPNALSLPARSLVTEINAIQDLHGYDHPWAGGAGKNQLDVGDSISDWFATTNNGGTIHTDGDISAKVTATISSSTGTVNVSNYDSTGYWWMSKVIKLKKNTEYKYAYSTHTGNFRIYGFNSLAEGATGTQLVAGATAFNSGDYEYYVFSIYPNSFNATGMMVILSTESNTFTPYSNICPISGRTEVTLTVEGE